MKGFQIQQKGERRISAALRIMLVVVLLAVQIGFVVAISYFMQEYLALAYGVVQVGALFLAVHIYNEPGELSYKLIWFILLLLAPPVGMILWFLWGGAAQKRHLPQNTKRFHGKLPLPPRFPALSEYLCYVPARGCDFAA